LNLRPAPTLALTGQGVFPGDVGLGQPLLVRRVELAEESIEGGNGKPEYTLESRRTAGSILVGNQNGQFTQKQGLKTLTPQVYCITIYLLVS